MKLPFLLPVVALFGLQAQTFPSPNTTRPTVVHKADPEYTTEATEAKIQGAVTLTATIGADGIPAEIKIVKGLGKGLDEKAVECLQKWRFKPATTNGEPIASKVTVEINFRLLPPPR
jgi:periplasmic protein TonB